MNNNIDTVNLAGNAAEDAVAIEHAAPTKEIHAAATDMPTPREVFAQMVALQRAMTENSFNSMHRLSEALSAIFGDGSVEYDDSDGVSDMVNEVTNVFLKREDNLHFLLNMYQQMYRDASGKQA